MDGDDGGRIEKDEEAAVWGRMEWGGGGVGWGKDAGDSDLDRCRGVPQSTLTHQEGRVVEKRNKTAAKRKF